MVSTIVFVRVIKSSPLTSIGTYAINEADFFHLQSNTKKLNEERKYYAAAYLKQIVNRLNRDGVKFQTDVIFGKVAKILVDYAETNDIDLILMAAHHRSGLTRLFRGSISDRILRASRVPVFVMRVSATKGESRHLIV